MEMQSPRVRHRNHSWESEHSNWEGLGQGDGVMLALVALARFADFGAAAASPSASKRNRFDAVFARLGTKMRGKAAHCERVSVKHIDPSLSGTQRQVLLPELPVIIIVI